MWCFFGWKKNTKQMHLLKIFFSPQPLCKYFSICSFFLLVTFLLKNNQCCSRLYPFICPPTPPSPILNLLLMLNRSKWKRCSLTHSLTHTHCTEGSCRRNYSPATAIGGGVAAGGNSWELRSRRWGKGTKRSSKSTNGGPPQTPNYGMDVTDVGAVLRSVLGP